MLASAYNNDITHCHSSPMLLLMLDEIASLSKLSSRSVQTSERGLPSSRKHVCTASCIHLPLISLDVAISEWTTPSKIRMEKSQNWYFTISTKQSLLQTCQ
jgi:hypothetical protein